MVLKEIIQRLPEIQKPAEKKLGFNQKLKWTLMVLGFYFVMYNIKLYGLSRNALERFDFLSTILGTDFGSIISLGIGPIVTSSIIIQLLVGSGILSIDTNRLKAKSYSKESRSWELSFLLYLKRVFLF